MIIEEISRLIESVPDTIEEGGWKKHSLVPLKQAILKLAAAVQNIQGKAAEPATKLSKPPSRR